MTRTSFGHTYCRLIEDRKVESELDWVMTNHPGMICETTVTDHSLSDHNPITWRMPTTEKKQAKKNTIFLRNYDKINSAKFKSDLVMQPWEDLDKMNVQDMAVRFNELLLDMLDKHAPLREVKHKPKKTPKPSASLRKLRRQRDNARSKGHLEALKSLRAQCTKQTRHESIEQAVERLKKGSQEAWKMVKETTGGSNLVLNTIKVNGRALGTEEAAEKFNRFFITKIEKIQARIEKSATDPLWGARKRADKLAIPGDNFAFKTVTEVDMVKAIKKMKNSKCVDIFGIAPAALKLAPEVIAVPLCYIVNEVIRSGEIPEVWKHGRVLPLHKKKAKDNVENYRPVCILPTASKVLEETMRRQLANYLEKMDILPTSQYGFRPGYSTVQAAGAVHHDWLKARQAGSHCGALFFDLSAAFDMLDAELLTAKLSTYGASHNVTSLIRSYMTGRKQCVDFGGSQSGLVDVGIGSPQGSIISPLLFLVMVADIGEWVSNGMILSYADDTTCYTSGKSSKEVRDSLSQSATEILDFMKASRLAANASKTKFIMFGRSNEEPLQVGNSFIPESKAEVLLGFIFSKNLSWKCHLENLVPELRKRIGILRRLTWQMPTKVVARMIEPIFTSKLRYGIEVIADVLNPHDQVIKKLSSLHRLAMKAALRLPVRKHMSYDNLLNQTNQASIEDLALRASTTLAWKCGKGWNAHPLTAGRLEEHLGNRETRQATSRTFPPQTTQKSTVTRTVEIWEKMPKQIREEQCEVKAKQLIRNWKLNN